MSKDTDIAWLAGFLDGEGTIGIARSNNKAQRHAYLRPHIQAPNTDRRLIEKTAEIIESVTGKRQSITHHTTKGARKDIWRVRVGTQWECAMLVPLLMPYLVSKKEQAHLVLEFCQRKLARSSYKWYEFKEQDELAYQKCMALNKRGQATESDPSKVCALKAIVKGA